MRPQDFSDLTDQELLDEAKKVKSNAIMNATLIGFMVGVVIYGVAKNNLGFFFLIPLFLAFKFFHKPQNNEALEKVLKERNLK
tara:strand:+ start:216 stop:464 length:249 start_codon:yes stop_codon:yes gene_type:complete